MEGWLSKDGFVNPRRDTPDVPGHGNAWLETGLAYACGMYDLSPAKATDMYLACTTSGSFPLFFRTPYKKNLDDSEEADDYWGFFALPIDLAYRVTIYNYLRGDGWNGDVHKQGAFRYYFNRFLPLPCYVSMRSGGSFTVLDNLILSAACLWSSFGISDADSNKKAFLMGHELSVRSKLGKWAFSIWCKRIRKRYGTIGKSWAASYEEGHPLSNYD